MGRGGAPKRYNQLKLWVAITDIIGFVLALVVARLIRTGWHPVPDKVNVLVAFSLLLLLLVFAAFRLYNLTQLSPAEEFSRIIWAVRNT